MPRILIAAATVLVLLAASQAQAQASAKRRCPTRALALETKRLVIFKVRLKPTGTEYIACWRSTGVHHAVTLAFESAHLDLAVSGPWVVFVRTDAPNARGRITWTAGTRNARTGAWGPVIAASTDGRFPKPSLGGPPGDLVVSSKGLFAWRADVAATSYAAAHEEILTAQRSKIFPVGVGAPVILADALMPDPGAPPFTALSFRNSCLLGWTVAPGLDAPAQADVCAAAAAR
ncbi:hypothetical protein [Amycolatopsis sp.]|jgi:hypothetical protein|uniref:hypothetical protein n=1 Tax=Amycolatopsis sp. TaxID=37632 RepID=UPI002E050966|nr:hypothetical protein [Amycolatopsis sp.]